MQIIYIYKMEAETNSALHKPPCAEYVAPHCSAYQDQTKVMNIALLYAGRDIGWDVME